MTYLITGGAGFIGANYCLYFLNSPYHKDDLLVVVDKLTYASNDLVIKLSKKIKESFSLKKTSLDITK